MYPSYLPFSFIILTEHLLLHSRKTSEISVICLEKLINGNTERAIYDVTKVFIICFQIPLI